MHRQRRNVNAQDRLLDIALAEVAGRRAPDVRLRVLSRLARPVPARLTRPMPSARRLPAVALVLLGVAAVCAVAIQGGSDRPAQDPDDPQTVLEQLRADVAKQEQAVKVLAWSAVSRITRGAGADQRQGEKRARVVCETKATGRAHVWCEPQAHWWVDHDRFSSYSEESVHARTDATIFRDIGNTGDIGTSNWAYGDVNEAGACATLWVRAGKRITWGWNWNDAGVLAWLRSARAADVRVTADEVEVQEVRSSNLHTSLRFARHGNQFSLKERRETIYGNVSAFLVVEDACIDGKIWFPRRIRVEQQLDLPWLTEIEITEVRLDPPLAEGTFTIVAPAKTRFTNGTDPQQSQVLTAQTPVLEGIVLLETETMRRPEPPTSLPPAKK